MALNMGISPTRSFAQIHPVSAAQELTDRSMFPVRTTAVRPKDNINKMLACLRIVSMLFAFINELLKKLDTTKIRIKPKKL